MALEALARFARDTFFHKRLYTTLAETLTTSELKKLRAEFEEMDHDKDGFVSRDHLVSALRRGDHSASQIEVESIFEACDLGADYLVSYDDFVLASVHRCRYLHEDRVDALFKEYLDSTRNEEFVTAESLRRHGFDNAAIGDVFAAAKVDLGGQIDRDQFDNLRKFGPRRSSSVISESQIPAKELCLRRRLAADAGARQGHKHDVITEDDYYDDDEDDEVKDADDVSIRHSSEYREHLRKIGVSDKNIKLITPR
ncbi:MAG: EF-hand domain-containing protein, partial [Actinomycetota bacterium]